MRHAASVQELPADAPLYIFGASAGGHIVLGEMAREGKQPLGFVDDTKTGRFQDLPILSTAQFVDQASAASVILIASQHWRAIGRKLAAVPAVLVDCSPMLRAANRARCTQLARQALSQMAEALVSATGLHVDEMLSRFPKSTRECLIQQRVAGLAPGLAPFFIVGEGLPAIYLGQQMENHDTLYLAGHVGGVREGFLERVDACPLETFLAETDAAENPLILVAAEGFGDLASRFLQHGFDRLVDLHPLLADSLTEHVPPLPAGGTVPALATIILDGPEDSRLLDALRQAQGEFVAVSLTGRPPTAEAMQAALAAMEDDRVGAVMDDADGIGFTLADYLFAAAMPRSSLWVFRSTALADTGLFDPEWNAAAPAFELWTRIACEQAVACVPALTPPPALPPRSVAEITRELGGRVTVLRRMFSVIGFFGTEEALLHQCFIRQFATAFNAAFAHRHDFLATLDLPDTGAAMRPVALPPPAVAVYDATAQSFERRGQIGHAMAIWDRVTGQADATIEGVACQSFLKSPESTCQSQMERQQAWALRHANWLWRGWDGMLPGPHRKLRLGYVCAFGAAPYFEYQVLPILQAHDRGRFDVFCYVDRATPRLRACADVIREVGDLDDGAFAAQVRHDGIHILVEVTGFSPGHRYGAMAERCAPIQISYINHTGTCGVPNVDYCLADDVAVPPEMDRWFTETVWRLPGTFFCFDFTDDVFPDVAPVPSTRTGSVTFGCFGAGSKINDRLIALWSDILRRLPDARLVLCNSSLSSIANRAYLTRRFARCGIGLRQLELRPGTDRETIKHYYADIDISLDTWPYCGGNTIAESLRCGVPVVTMTGDTFASRYGASLLNASGCAELIATSQRDYVAKAVALAGDPVALARYRRELRNMVQHHGFSDSRRFAANLERAYEDMASRPLRLPPKPTGPDTIQLLENENRQLRTELGALTRSLAKPNGGDPFGLGTYGVLGERGNFLVTSWGHSASIWLAGSLNLHGDILCNCGIRHPIDSFFRYTLHQDGAAWVKNSTPDMFRHGMHPDRVQFFAKEFQRLGRPVPPMPPRETDMQGSFVLDELETMAAASGHPILGNVHGLILPHLVQALRANPETLKGRRTPILNLIRHPVPRTESAIKATIHYHLDSLKADIDRLIDNNLEEFRAIEKKFKVDLDDPRVRAVIHIYRQGLQNKVWSSELEYFPHVKHILMERLQNDPDYYLRIFDILTEGRITADKDYIDKVFSPENLGSGRRGSLAAERTRPPMARDQFEQWSEFEKQEFRLCAARLDLRNIYAPFDYDFSFIGDS